MNIEAVLAEVVEELSWVDPPPVFIGGATIGLFLDEFGRSQLRGTKDVDCIVPAVLTAMDWFGLEAQARSRGWTPDRDGPICRYISPKGHMVDLLAARPEVQGFTGTWFGAAVAHAERRLLSDGSAVMVPAVPWLLACKIEAFEDRGRRDPLASTDFEDIIAILDGCARAEGEIIGADPAVRALIGTWCAAVLQSRDLGEAAEGHLPRGLDDAGRRMRLRGLLGRLTTLKELASPPTSPLRRQG